MNGIYHNQFMIYVFIHCMIVTVCTQYMPKSNPPLVHPYPNSENNLTQNACVPIACKSNDYFKHFSELNESIMLNNLFKNVIQ